MTEFYFIRHGQTEANALGLKQGTINSDITFLNENGKKQAKHLHDHFDLKFADQLLISPLHRTQETAALLNTTAKLPTETDSRLLEISYGKWDGLKNLDLQTKYPDVFDPVLHDVLPSYTKYATDGETFDHVVDRVTAFMTDYANRSANGKFIVVTHGFTVKAAALAALQPQDAMTLPEPENTSVTKISLIDGRYYLWFYNRLY
ncbi:histidine phosphatase family protein [Lactobacillus sp. LC28-10]|uniref:Histidine phosphatase family protein n=1 Tax=Secundilactobacillus angelensis TaxID=2722706 RepID=A0ABX1KZ36_9LACO|nr:histidine phosphatase family protein [Secundilactobacillus angelensis]MCH5462450.1 histidine phosphatase family protein [Secundilactobacillus angelensis]NLR18068.1 histidine phosphatase family protein [Secundilactobacillus angelensis]